MMAQRRAAGYDGSIMKLISRKILPLVVCALVCGAVLSGSDRRAMEFTFKDINPASPSHGQELTLSEVYADGGVVVNFLASWCKYCWDEIPHLDKLNDGGKVNVIGIAADEYGDPRNVLMLLERSKSTIPVLWVPEEMTEKMEEVYDHEILPATYMIDDQGAIKRVLQGKVNEATLVNAIRQSIGSDIPSAPGADGKPGSIRF